MRTEDIEPAHQQNRQRNDIDPVHDANRQRVAVVMIVCRRAPGVAALVHEVLLTRSDSNAHGHTSSKCIPPSATDPDAGRRTRALAGDGQSGAPPPGSAHECIVAFEEAKLTFDLVGNPDSNAYADGSRAPARCAQPQRARGAKVDSVESPIDVHRR